MIPYRGGSHLPDVTVVTPVFAEQLAKLSVERPGPDFFVANRAHHAEIGGIVPGSMPPFSKNLSEEGVLIRSRKLVDAGQSREEGISVSCLRPVRFPAVRSATIWRTRRLQVAANACGVRLLQQLCERHEVDAVQSYMPYSARGDQEDAAGNSTGLTTERTRSPIRWTMALESPSRSPYAAMKRRWIFPARQKFIPAT
ncbi:MAG: hydantoinase B/oxoprolinase family protein [Planctomycetaceae bacterium]